MFPLAQVDELVYIWCTRLLPPLLQTVSLRHISKWHMHTASSSVFTLYFICNCPHHSVLHSCNSLRCGLIISCLVSPESNLTPPPGWFPRTLFDLLTPFLKILWKSVWQTLRPSTSLQITQFHFFLWLSNIPLYICATSSLSIHLSMDT